jgi:hypothetical protein
MERPYIDTKDQPLAKLNVSIRVAKQIQNYRHSNR